MNIIGTCIETSPCIFYCSNMYNYLYCNHLYILCMHCYLAMMFSALNGSKSVSVFNAVL